MTFARSGIFQRTNAIRRAAEICRIEKALAVPECMQTLDLPAQILQMANQLAAVPWHCCKQASQMGSCLLRDLGTLKLSKRTESMSKY